MPPTDPASETLAAEFERRLTGISPRREPITVAAPPEWIAERQRSDRRRRATGWIAFAVAVAFVGLPAAIGAVVVATDWFTRGPSGQDELAVFLGGLAVGTPAAIAAGVIAFWNRSVLAPAVMVAAVLPWLLVSAVAMWALTEIT